MRRRARGGDLDDVGIVVIIAQLPGNTAAPRRQHHGQRNTRTPEHSQQRGDDTAIWMGDSRHGLDANGSSREGVGQTCTIDGHRSIVSNGSTALGYEWATHGMAWTITACLARDESTGAAARKSPAPPFVQRRAAGSRGATDKPLQHTAARRDRNTGQQRDDRLRGRPTRCGMRMEICAGAAQREGVSKCSADVIVQE
ncbi:hypothetical protein BJ912DRAFT_287234 [Pholiota molesta]|nr:hypothetical protein BJ912DRAFT_287169 [Pholiota molesta]KAF8191766.1 hypothetical protein BJ912DRAFT_287234 [Pholiota molesta]